MHNVLDARYELHAIQDSGRARSPRSGAERPERTTGLKQSWTFGKAWFPSLGVREDAGLAYRRTTHDTTLSTVYGFVLQAHNKRPLMLNPPRTSIVRVTIRIPRFMSLSILYWLRYILSCFVVLTSIASLPLLSLSFLPPSSPVFFCASSRHRASSFLISTTDFLAIVDTIIFSQYYQRHIEHKS